MSRLVSGTIALLCSKSLKNAELQVNGEARNLSYYVVASLDIPHREIYP